MKHHKEREACLTQRAAHYHTAGINDKLIINLRDLSHMMRFLYEGKGSQRRILIVLNEIGGITQRELTERLGIQPGSASEVIAKLESAGYIRRSVSDTDRRTVDIALTEEGKKAASEAAEQRSRRHGEMFTCLSDDEKHTLLSLLEKVNADWETRYGDVGEHHGSGADCHKRHMPGGQERC